MLILVLSLSACNLPTSSEPDSLSEEGQVATLVAQTVTAAKMQIPTQTRHPSNTPSKNRPTKTSTPAESPTPSESPTPTETAHPLGTPSLKTYDFICSWIGSNTEMEMIIEWIDKADNELGYRIYRNGEMIVELGANTTKYTDLFSAGQGQPANYAIEAYNDGGASGKITFSETCDKK